MIPVIDLEASGLSTQSFPIEVGIYVPDSFETIEESWLIKPEPEWLEHRIWDEKSAKVHNISIDMLKNEGVDGHIVCSKLNSLLSGTTIYSDAPDFDEMWLKIMFNHFKIDMHFDIDHVLYPNDKKLRKKLFKKDVSFEDFRQLKNKQLSKPGFNAHRALDDAKAMGLVMKKLLK